MTTAMHATRRDRAAVAFRAAVTGGDPMPVASIGGGARTHYLIGDYTVCGAGNNRYGPAVVRRVDHSGDHPATCTACTRARVAAIPACTECGSAAGQPCVDTYCPGSCGDPN